MAPENNTSIDDKVEEQPHKLDLAQNIVNNVKNTMKKSSTGKKILIGTGIAVTTPVLLAGGAVYGIYRFVSHPPKLKTMLKLAGTGILTLSILYPRTAIRTVGDGFEWVKTEYIEWREGIRENKKANQKAEDAKKRENAAIQQLTEEQRKGQQLAQTIKELYDKDVVFERESQSKDQRMNQLIIRNSELATQMSGLRSIARNQDDYIRMQENGEIDSQTYAPQIEEFLSDTNAYHFVQEKDMTLAELAQRYFCDVSHWRELARINNLLVLPGNKVIIKMGQGIKLGSDYVVSDDKLILLEDNEMPSVCYDVRSGDSIDESIIKATGSLVYKQDIIDYNAELMPDFMEKMQLMEKIWIPNKLVSTRTVGRTINEFPSRFTVKNYAKR